MRTPFLLAGSVVFLAACSSAPTATATCNLATLVAAGPTSVLVRGTITLTVTATENAGSSCTLGELSSVAWSSLNTSVATVSASGQVTGVSPGVATISADLLSKNATHLVQVNPTPTANLTVSPANPSLAVGLTQQMLANCTDSAGFPTPCTATWSSPSSGVATITASGLVTATAPGTLVVTATVGTVTGQTTVTVTGAATVSPLAFALADQPTASGPYAPDPAFHFNALGGAMSVTRSAIGRYQVTIPGFGGASGSSRMAMAGAVNDNAVVCLVLDATMVGVTDAVVNVACSDHTGTAIDSRFTLLAVGQAAFPGNFAFGHLATLPSAGGGATLSLPTSDSWSSSNQTVQVVRDNINTQGRFSLNLKLPVMGGAGYAPVVASAGTATSRCTLSSWGTNQDVVCYPPGGGSLTDARFSGMLLDQGRGGMRLGSVWANNPTSASYSAPALAYRNSSGGAGTITRSATGRYTVTFQNLGRPSGRRELALVTTHELLTAASCRVRTPWSTAVSADLSIEVACHAADGAARDQGFLLVVVE